MVELSDVATRLDLTTTWVGIAALVAFILAYAVVIGEEYLHIRKSMPVLIAAGVIWALIGWRYAHIADAATDPQTKLALAQFAEVMVRHNLLEYAELFLFLLAAMTFINSMEERGVFDALRGWMVTRGFSLRSLFWVTGGLAFCISPVADNLTTALLMGTVVLSVGVGNPRFVLVSLINIVVAANAGGAFSPFGDITTLMVWQKGLIPFSGFFALFLPSLVNWLVPAAIMSTAVGVGRPAPITEQLRLQPGAFVIVGLFLLTIAATVSVHQFLHLPPVLGMMTGLGVLKLYGWTLQRSALRLAAHKSSQRESTHRVALQSVDSDNPFEVVSHAGADREPFDVFKHLERAEWDTLMFFYGVILCVGGLGAIGYLEAISNLAYGGFGATKANVAIGVLSALIDNIPVMFAVLSMQPPMDAGQWLLVTLTAGVGGSLLSIGSAAGVALMGQARGTYTFVAHLKWSWAIALGYIASVWVHFLVNGALFTGVAVQ
ncbi:sodium:proton antiporter NhaD [Gemmatimonas sp.]|uniref:sodium:proton antiporter NhaD n=1 Tax=Gemmatimonas sp. TaxID=1962908 RepID=UPI0039837688